MKSVALSILLLLSVASFASAEKRSAGTDSGRLSRKQEISRFRPDEVVVRIRKRHVDSKESLNQLGLSVTTSGGTGYCLGPGECDFILTNYHVAERVGSPLEVDGEKVLQTYEATSPQDKDAVWQKSPQGSLIKLAPVRDIAIFRMKNPLVGMHGVPFSLRELHDGENVRIYGHPGGKRLAMAEATFYRETTDGLLLFRVKAEDEKFVVPGISGSLVMNDQNEAVGIVQGIADENLASVVPVWSVADFVKKSQPDLYAKIFGVADGEAIYRAHNSTRYQSI